MQGEKITKQDIGGFGATVGYPCCNAIKDNKRAQAHSDRCRVRMERIPRKGVERDHLESGRRMTRNDSMRVLSVEECRDSSCVAS